MYIASAHHGIEMLVGHIGRHSTILYVFYRYITKLSSASCLRKCHLSDIPRPFWGLNLVSPHHSCWPSRSRLIMQSAKLTHRDQHWKIHINLVSELLQWSQLKAIRSVCLKQHKWSSPPPKTIIIALRSSHTIWCQAFLCQAVLFSDCLLG